MTFDLKRLFHTSSNSIFQLRNFVDYYTRSGFEIDYYRSGEENIEESKSWYHYPETKDRFDLNPDTDQDEDLSDDNEETDLGENAKYKLESEAKDVLRESWKHLQSR